MTTIFDKILAGEIPCHKVYEDDNLLAILDILPMSEGHTIVISKEAAPTLDKLSDESAAAIGRILPRLSRAILRATGATDFNLLQNNGPSAYQEVMRVHFHIIPKHSKEDGLRIGKGSSHNLEQNKGQALAKKIASEMSGV
ncbi:MAG: HIT domain-containing protein [Deltaproteobacteria bacterium]|nr:HIT domain-containing protein [Deltaproteobacteria bacterium]